MRRSSTHKVCYSITIASFVLYLQILTPTPGWGKKLSYCIAFSADGCCDVTRRYVRDPEHSIPRTKCPEGVLVHIIREINALRRKDMDKKQKFQLNAEDMREDGELRKGIIEALAYNVSRILPGGDGEKGSRSFSTNDADAQKAAERSSSRSAAERLRTRGEPGPNPADASRDQRQQ
jgi:peptide-N4-(N-acetyl-beta-glucosaminyl)asparagine amidase